MALNAKLGALVEVSDTTVYLVEGLEAWPEKIYGKKVEVQCNIIVLKHKGTAGRGLVTSTTYDSDWVEFKLEKASYKLVR